jgi:hypothetical protein
MMQNVYWFKDIVFIQLTNSTIKVACIHVTLVLHTQMDELEKVKETGKGAVQWLGDAFGRTLVNINKMFQSILNSYED